MENKVAKYILRTLLVILTTVLIIVITLFAMLKMMVNGPSESAKNMLVSTLLESGQLKFVAKMVCSSEEIEKINELNKMKKMDVDVDEGLIQIGDSTPIIVNPDGEEVVISDDYNYDENGIALVEISGRSFFAKMLIIKDPSQVRVGTTASDPASGTWTEYGKELSDIVKNAGAIAGVNGGIYVSTGNKGGQPMGVVVQDGVISYNRPQEANGIYMIGMNKDNILIVEDISAKSAEEFKQYVEEKGIRDAVAFQEESSDANNHFVPLIINGESRELNGQGSGANPRTVIGQRSDGAILLLVTDGRGTAGHLGATASDLIAIMQEYGAVNAANLDGGSSSTMVYNGGYEMTSVTFYYQNSSWLLPTAFVVDAKEN